MRKKAKNYKYSTQGLKNYDSLKPFRTLTNNPTCLSYPWLYHYRIIHENSLITRNKSAYHERLRISSGRLPAQTN